MKMYTKWERPPHKAEKPYGKKIVETAGYIPAKKQIENLIMAGERLEAYRAGLYDFPEGDIDENFYDPTRDPDFDIADASRIDKETTSRLKEQERKANEEKKAKDAEKKAKAKADAEELENFRKKNIDNKES